MALVPRLVRKRVSAALTGDKGEWSLGPGEQIGGECVGFPHRSASLHFRSGPRIERRVEVAEHVVACRTTGCCISMLHCSYCRRDTLQGQRSPPETLLAARNDLRCEGGCL
ncbi:hypothetical protein ACFX11_040452 [Malus domestica]